MATIADDIVKAVMTLHGGPPPLLHLAEAASQTFVKGEFVYIGADGYVYEIGGDTPAVIYGVAAQNGHNAATDGLYDVAVHLASPEVLFEGNVKEAALADHTFAQTDLGTTMAIQRDTTNSKTFLNSAVVAGANVRVFTHRRARGSAIGDTNARVLFNFLPNTVQFQGTS